MNGDFELDIEKPPALGDTIYQQLQEAILAGNIAPGTTLVQHELAQRLGVSRTPVRDALERLTRDGLVVRSNGGRVYVAELSLEDLREKYQVRRSLEGLAAYLAAERITQKDLDRLAQILDDMRDAVDKSDTAEVTRNGSQFHAIITAACGNEFLKQLLGDLTNSIRRYRSTAVDIPGRSEESLSEHETIYFALKDRDGQKAEHTMRDHVRQSQKQLEQAVKQSQLLAEDGNES